MYTQSIRSMGGNLALVAGIRSVDRLVGLSRYLMGSDAIDNIRTQIVWRIGCRRKKTTRYLVPEMLCINYPLAVGQASATLTNSSA